MSPVCLLRVRRLASPLKDVRTDASRSPPLIRLHWPVKWVVPVMPKAFKVGALTARPHVRGGVPSGRWQVDVPDNLTLSGKRKRVMFPSAREAEQGARAILLEVQLNGAYGRLPQQDRITPSLAEVAEHWVRDQQVRVDAGKKRKSSLVTNLYQLAPLLSPSGCHRGRWRNLSRSHRSSPWRTYHHSGWPTPCRGFLAARVAGRRRGWSGRPRGDSRYYRTPTR